MTKAQKGMKYLGIAYFIIVLFGVLLGGLFIWAYSHSYEFHHTNVMRSVLLTLSFTIIVNVLCWNACMKAAYNPESASYPLMMGTFGLLLESYHFVTKAVILGMAAAVESAPWLSVTLYVLTVIVALMLKKEVAAVKSNSNPNSFSYGNSKHLVVK